MYQKICSIIIFILTSSTASNVFSPHDNELLFEYKALIKAGTQLPIPHASVFRLEGTLHYQPDNGSAFVKLSNLKYITHNGAVHPHVEHEEHPLPTEVQDLEQTFKIHYDVDCKSLGISTEQNEKEYSRNVKKAIASIFQLDCDQIKFNGSHDSFVTLEHSIYGASQLNYVVLPHSGWLEVHKMQELTKRELKHHVIDNRNELECDVLPDDPISFDSQRKYHFHKENTEEFGVTYIEATGGVYTHLFEGQSDIQHLFTNQTFRLIKSNSNYKKLSMNHEYRHNHLTINLNDDGSHDDRMGLDISGGRRRVAAEKPIEKVEKMLEEVVLSMKEDNVDMSIPADQKKGQLIYRLHQTLLHFNFDNLMSLLKNVKEIPRINSVFYEILPLIGTKTSLQFIKHLLVNDLIAKDYLFRLLENFPRHVKVPTKKLLTEMEELINLPETIDVHIRNTAVLAFASLVHFTYKYESENSIATNIEDYYDKYIDIYIKKLKDSPDFDDHPVYLHGLHNMRLPKVVDHLKIALKDNWWPDHNHKVLLLWTIRPYNADEAFEIFWRYLSDHNEHPEVRMVAYYRLMKENVTKSGLLNVFWHMQHESDEEMYNFYYTHMHSLAQATKPCQSQLKLHAKQLLKYLKPPRHGLSSYKSISFVDSEYGFGARIDWIVIKTNSSITLRLFLINQDNSRYREPLKLHIKVRGFGDGLKLFKLHKKDGKVRTGFSNYFEEVRKAYNLKKNPDIHVELTGMRQSQVVTSINLNSSNINILSKYVKNVFHQEKPVETIRISFEAYAKLFLPTDIGFPAILTKIEPLVESVYKNNQFGKPNWYKMNLQSTFNMSSHQRMDVSFYNPILDIHQGIVRYTNYDHTIPLNLNATMSLVTNLITVDISPKDPRTNCNVFGLRQHTSSAVYIEDNLNKLNNLNSHVIVGRKDHQKRNVTILDMDSLNTGLHYHIVAFDTNQYISNGTFLRKLHQILNPANKNFKALPQYLRLLPLNTFYWNQHAARPGNSGLYVRIEPTTAYPVNKLNLWITWDYDMKHGVYLYEPQFRFVTTITYAISNNTEDKALKVLEAHVEVNLNDGHTVNSFKSRFARIFPVPGMIDYQVCVDGTKKWNTDGVSGHLNIGMTESDEKCPKDKDSVIDITMTGERSKDQIGNRDVYGSCEYPVPYSQEHFHTIECLREHTTVRDYKYAIKTKNLTSGFKRDVSHVWDYVKAMYMDYYQYSDEHDVEIGDENMQVELLYPMVGEKVEMQVYTQQDKFSFTGVPLKHFVWSVHQPDSMVFSREFEYLHEKNLVDHCEVDGSSLYYNFHCVKDYREDVFTKEWKTFIADDQNNIQLKKDEHNQFVVQIHSNTSSNHSHVINIDVRDGEVNAVRVDEREINSTKVFNENWIYVQIMKDEIDKPVLVVLPESGLQLVYTLNHLQVIIPKVVNVVWTGVCVDLKDNTKH